MSIDVDRESLLSLTEATRVLPRKKGKRAAISTLWRWCRKGIKGVRLEYIRVGRSIVTSREALNRFYVVLAAADPLPESPAPAPERLPAWPNTPAARRLSLEQADQILIRAGIKKAK